MMNVRQLKALLEGVGEDLPVLLAGGSDHSYNTVSGGGETTVALGKRGQYAEWYDERNASPGEKPVPGFVLG